MSVKHLLLMKFKTPLLGRIYLIYVIKCHDLCAQRLKILSTRRNESEIVKEVS